MPHGVPIPYFLADQRLFSSRLISVLGLYNDFSRGQTLCVFPITISAPDFCALSNSFCSTPCGRKSSASKKNRYFPSAFCNPQFLAPAPPPIFLFYYHKVRVSFFILAQNICRAICRAVLDTDNLKALRQFLSADRVQTFTQSASRIIYRNNNRYRAAAPEC